jgi:hypothetical protein
LKMFETPYWRHVALTMGAYSGFNQPAPHKEPAKQRSKNMKSKLMSASVLVLALTAVSSFAEDAVTKVDEQKVSQDKKDLKESNQTVKAAKEEVKKDAASGDQSKVATDKKALREARRNRRQAKHRLHEDKGQLKQDEKIKQ